MAEVRKILGQLVPPALTVSDFYTVPSATEAVVSTVLVCNMGATAMQFRASVAPGGTADSPEQYMYWDFTIPAYDSFAATIGVTMSQGDVLRCYSTESTTAFQAFGVEIT